MTQLYHRGFTAVTATEVVASLAVAAVGVIFTAEGLLGYFYNATMFLEGLDHIWEIYGGLAVAAVGAIVAFYFYIRR